MKLLIKREPIMIRIAIFHVLFGSFPQIWFAWAFLNNSSTLDRAFTSPIIILLIICLPGIIYKRIVTKLACWGMDKDEFENVHSDWVFNEPKIFWLPLFQFHSGLFHMFKITIIVIVRFFQTLICKVEDEDKLWRSEFTYLFDEPSLD